MNARDFLKWLDGSNKGHAVTYHTGDLQYDRQNERRPEHRTINHVADAAWRAKDKKQVALAQRRVGPNTFAYVAQRI